VDGLWATKSEGVGLSVRAISFQDFQPMWSWSTNVQTDGQTDRRTTCNLNTALCTSASRGNNIKYAVKQTKTQTILLSSDKLWIGLWVSVCVLLAVVHSPSNNLFLHVEVLSQQLCINNNAVLLNICAAGLFLCHRSAHCSRSWHFDKKSQSLYSGTFSFSISYTVTVLTLILVD